MHGTIRVAICETDVFGVKAYHCRCLECGWQSKRYDHEALAVRYAKAHGCEPKAHPMATPDACDNCGTTRDLLACAGCNRTICDGCYHCGDAGKVCGLCLDREIEGAQDVQGEREMNAWDAGEAEQAAECRAAQE